jgi:hypothetical protein
MARTSLAQRVTRLEAELAQIKSQQQSTQKQELPPEQPWWESIIGVFADNPLFEAAVEEGRNYRQSLAKVESGVETI